MVKTKERKKKWCVVCHYCGFRQTFRTEREAQAAARRHRYATACDWMLEIASNVVVQKESHCHHGG